MGGITHRGGRRNKGVEGGIQIHSSLLTVSVLDEDADLTVN